MRNCNSKSRIIRLILINFLLSCTAAFASNSLSYSGRLVNANGSPVNGNVNLKAELAYTNSLTTIRCIDVVSNVPLSNGVFHTKLDFDCDPSTLSTVLALIPTNESVAIRITDITDLSNPKAYSFQSLYSVPSSIISRMALQIAQMSATDGQVLTWDGSANKWVPQSPGGNGTVTSISTGIGLAGGVIENSGTISIATQGVETILIKDGAVTSVKIEDGTIVDADISATAQIEQSKIKDLTTALAAKESLISSGSSTDYLDGNKAWQDFNQAVRSTFLLGYAVVPTPTSVAATDTVLEAIGKLEGQIIANDTAFDNSGQWSKDGSLIYYNTGNVGIGTSTPGEMLQVAGNLAVDGKLRLKDSGANFVELKSPTTLSGTVTFTLPSALGTNGQVLITDASGNMSWSTLSTDSSAIVDGSIVDDDISASANIAQSKILNLTTDLASKQASDSDLTALAGLTGTGVLVRTGDGTAITRTIEGTANRLSVTDGNGVAGNPVLDISTSLLPSPLVGDAGKFLKASGANISAWQALASGDITTALGFTPINKSGDSITSGVFDFNTSSVVRVLDPIGTTDVANKQYVDSQVAGASNQWAQSSGNVYRTSGNVGIGTTSPTVKAHVHDTVDGIFTGLVIDNRKAYGVGTGTNEISRFILSLSEGGAPDPLTRVMGYVAAGTESESSSLDGFMSFGTRTAGSETEKMRITSTGNVGIGTTTPVQKLDLQGGNLRIGSLGGGLNFDAGDASPNSGFLRFGDGTGWKFHIGRLSETVGGSRNIGTTGVVMTVDSGSGKVGVGTTTPDRSLDVVGDIRAYKNESYNVIESRTASEANLPPHFILRRSRGTVQSPTYVQTNDTLGLLTFRNHSASQGATVVSYATENQSASSWGANLAFFTVANGSTVNSERMRIDQSGYIGIGTSSPQSKLHVSGNTRTEGNLELYKPSALADDRLWYITHAGTDDLHFAPRKDDGSSDGSYALSIQRNGNIGIGSTTPAYKLHVLGTGFFDDGASTVQLLSRPDSVLDVNNSTASKRSFSIHHYTGSSIIAQWYNCPSGVCAQKMAFDTAGNMVIAGSLTQSSDRNLKKDIRSLTNSLAKISTLKGVSYNWKDETNPEKQIGLIAQEVAEVYPEVVRKNNDGLLSVGYQNLIAPIIEAIKELNIKMNSSDERYKREIASLKEQNEKLQKQNELFEKRLEALENKK